MPPTPASTSKNLFLGLNCLLGVAFIVELFAPRFSPEFADVTIFLAALVSIAALNRQLPLQNVLPVAFIAALIGSLAHGLSASPNISLPFGPLVFNPAAGAKIFGFVPWTIPFLWIVAIFNARGTARLILRPWRKVKNYGFWLIGFTALLAMAFDIGLEPYAWHVNHFWLWQHTKINLTWDGATLMNFVGWLFVSLLIMLVATPSMIRKQPGSHSEPDYHSFAIWLGAFLLFASGSASVGHWWPVAMDVLIAGVTTAFAVRGAKW
jgi:uncharacterized membrane protein